MFWRWNSEYAFMDREPGEHLSQTEMLSQRLFGLTFWGDYSGDIVSRYHFVLAQEIAPNITSVERAAFGQGLMLGDIGMAGPGELHNLIEFLSFFDPEAENYGDYPIYDDSEFSQWEWNLSQEEMTSGWWADNAQGELADEFRDWEYNTLVPEKHSEEWAELVYEYMRYSDDNGLSFEPYWEGADSFYVGGWDTKEVAEWLLTRYAESITNAGNPEPLI